MTLEETTGRHTSMNNGKAPGPDGFPVELYKIFFFIRNDYIVGPYSNFES